MDPKHDIIITGGSEVVAELLPVSSRDYVDSCDIVPSFTALLAQNPAVLKAQPW